MPGLIQLTPPAEEPVTLDEAKLHLRVTDTAQDALITSLIQAAREHAETALTHRAFITQQWRLTLDEFPAHDLFIRLPKPPLVSVEAVRYTDGNGALQVWDPANYAVDTGSLPGKIDLGYGLYFPIGRYQANAIQIDFTCGYGAAADVPEAIKTAIKLLVAHWYENREPVNVGNLTTSLQFTVDALLGTYTYREIA